MENKFDRDIYITPFTAEGVFFYSYLEAQGIKVKGFCDCKEELTGLDYKGCSVLIREQVVAQHRRNPALFLIVSRNHGKRIAQELLQANMHVALISDRDYSQIEWREAQGLRNVGETDDFFHETDVLEFENMVVDLAACPSNDQEMLQYIDSYFRPIKGKVKCLSLWAPSDTTELKVLDRYRLFLGHLVSYKEKLNRLVITASFMQIEKLVPLCMEAGLFQWLATVEFVLLGVATKDQLKEFKHFIEQTEVDGAVFWDTDRSITVVKGQRQSPQSPHIVIFHTAVLQIVESTLYDLREDHYKAIFLPNTLSAHMSIQRHLFGNIAYSDIKGWADIQNHGRQDYYIFICVRNPWDRLVSLFYRHRERYTGVSLIPSEKHERCQEDVDLFRGLVKRIGVCPSYPALYQQHKTACNENGDLFIQYVIYYEHLQQGVDHVADILGMAELVGKPIRNTVKTKTDPHRLPYQDYYDDETRDIVARLYAKDIELFGYEFEGIKPEYLRKWGYQI